MTLRETDLVINEGLTISGKSMREHLEVINHQEAIAYIKDLMQRNSSINERGTVYTQSYFENSTRRCRTI
jgi:Fic family protein